MRMNAFIAKSGFSSRRKAVSFIKEGRVEVNGKFVREPWYEIRKNDKISIDGRLLRLQQYTYLIVNKPKGVVTTLKDRFQKRKITDTALKQKTEENLLGLRKADYYYASSIKKQINYSLSLPLQMGGRFNLSKDSDRKLLLKIISENHIIFLP